MKSELISMYLSVRSAFQQTMNVLPSCDLKLVTKIKIFDDLFVYYSSLPAVRISNLTLISILACRNIYSRFFLYFWRLRTTFQRIGVFLLERGTAFSITMLLTDSCHILSFISFLIFFRTASNIVSPMRLFLLSSYISSHSFRRSLCLSNYRENSYCLILVLICSQLIERATSFARRVSFVI